jgi:phage host-nuclease inhibitor protein Gam
MSTAQDVATQPAAQPAQVDIGKYIAKAVELRDLIAQMNDDHAKVMKPYNEAYDALKVFLLGQLTAMGTDKIANKTAGTISRLNKTSASVEDREVLLDYVRTNGDWGLINISANKDSVAQFIKNTNGDLPPGVKWTQFYDLSLRRPTKTGDE